MATRPAHELLYDSEASLRLVDNAIRELHLVVEDDPLDAATLASSDGRALPPTVVAQLPKLLLHAYGEITRILEQLRESRSVLERAQVERLAHMHDKLREVSSATESAATDILNSCDRATAMVDELDTLEGADASTRAAELRTALRDELYGITVHLQFQDITTQQLNYASSVIADMERRLAEICSVFDPSALGLDPAGYAPAPALAGVAFDPNATTAHAGDRQALADEIFTVKR